MIESEWQYYTVKTSKRGKESSWRMRVAWGHHEAEIERELTPGNWVWIQPGSHQPPTQAGDVSTPYAAACRLTWERDTKVVDVVSEGGAS